MSTSASQSDRRSPAVETFLLGRIEFERCLQLQRELAGRVAARDDGQVVLLLCEHEPIITIGRGGSPGELAAESGLVRDRRIEVRWVNRGGGCMVHCPGQLAIYPIVPLRWHGMSVGEYLERLQAGIVEALDDLGIRGRTPPGQWGVVGRTGQLAAVGVAVRDWVTYYGAYLNVCPAMGLFRLVENDTAHDAKASCLVAERRGNARMTTVRAAIAERLTEALGCDRYHLFTGHPLLRRDHRQADGG